jgi:hypothetical protein
MPDAHTRPIARRLRDAVEPIAANVYFAPEAQAAYAELGLTYLPGYFCSRGGCLGTVPGEVVAAAFAVFNPDIVIPAVTEGWTHTDAPSILAARQKGATASLAHLIDAPPAATARATELLIRAAAAGTVEGRPLFAGLRSLGWPGDPVGDLWRAADLVREHRGDSHTAAWVAAGVDAVEITLLTSAWWGVPVRSYIRTRGWTPDQIEVAIAALTDRKLLDGDALTADGRELRLAIEDTTDRGVAPVMDALGDHAAELCELLEPWAKAIVAAKGYPVDPSSLRVPRS